jgi:hypothetical protein
MQDESKIVMHFAIIFFDFLFASLREHNPFLKRTLRLELFYDNLIEVIFTQRATGEPCL